MYQYSDRCDPHPKMEKAPFGQVLYRVNRWGWALSINSLKNWACLLCRCCIQEECNNVEPPTSGSNNRILLEVPTYRRGCTTSLVSFQPKEMHLITRSVGKCKTPLPENGLCMCNLGWKLPQTYQVCIQYNLSVIMPLWASIEARTSVRWSSWFMNDLLLFLECSIQNTYVGAQSNDDVFESRCGHAALPTREVIDRSFCSQCHVPCICG